MYTLTAFSESHHERAAKCSLQLQDFSAAAHGIVESACCDALAALQQQLEALKGKAVDTDSGNSKGVIDRHAAAPAAATLCICGEQRSCENGGSRGFIYTAAAAHRSEQRRLLCFVRMADLMMCDCLRSVLLASLRDVLAALAPAQFHETDVQASAGTGVLSFARSSAHGRPSLMSGLPPGSRRQRTASALAGVHPSPITHSQLCAAAGGDNKVAADSNCAAAAQLQCGGAAGTQRSHKPLYEIEVLLTPSLEDLALEPEPERLQVCPPALCLPDAAVCAASPGTPWAQQQPTLTALTRLLQLAS